MSRRKPEKQRCPRRGESPDPDAYGDGTDTPDTYTKGHGLVGVQGDNLSCSYCGSLHPDTFMDWARRGAILEPTSKSYKVYVECPDENPRYGETKTKKIANGTMTTVYGRTAKFYFQHLTVEQRREFVDLLNDGTLQFRKIDLGGVEREFRFNPLPFFMRSDTRFA